MMKQNKNKIDCTSDDVVLIITACIQPNQNQRYLALKDVSERLRQYVACIEYYINDSPFHNIVFCDNSNYYIPETSALIQRARDKGKELEMLRFMGNSELVAKYSTKGIGEDEIMDYVLTNSVLISCAKMLFKVTGRLIVTNLHRLVEGVCYGKNYFLRDIYSDTCSLDTRFFAVDVDCYNKTLRRCYERINDYDMSYERVFYLLLGENRLPLCCYPRFVGCSSGVGTNYGAESKLKLRIFDILCRWGAFNYSCCFVPLLYTNIMLKKTGSLFHRLNR